MANAVTNVTVSLHVSASNPILPIIEVDEVIKGGAGTLIETIMGGQVRLAVRLTSGNELRAIKEGELVYVRGDLNGAPFILNMPLLTHRTHKPWEFTRISG